MFIARLVYQALPEKIANRMLMLGEMLEAPRLKELHVVNELAKPENVLETAKELVKPICELSGAVMRAGKKAIRKQRDFDFEGAMSFLGEELKANLALNDSKEGISAFLEKRRPNWSDS